MRPAKYTEFVLIDGLTAIMIGAGLGPGATRSARVKIRLLNESLLRNGSHVVG